MRINMSSVVVVSIMVAVFIVMIAGGLVVVVIAMVVVVMVVVSTVVWMMTFVLVMRMWMMMILVMVMMMVIWLRNRKWLRKRNVIRSTSTSTVPVVDKRIVMIAHIVICCYHPTSFWNPQKPFSSIFCLHSIQLHLLFRIIINMVQYLAQHLDRVFLVLHVVLHMRVPHKICKLVRHNDLGGTLEAHVEELYIVHVALFEL